MAVGAALVAASALAGATPAAAAPGDIPVTFADTGDSGSFYPTVEILLGSDPDPYTVVLDTGSEALVMYSPVAGAVATGATASVTYVGSSVVGTVSTADFSIGGNTATGINFLDGSGCTGCAMPGIDGVLGISQGLDEAIDSGTSTTVKWYSPFLQFDDTTLSAGHTLNFGDTSGTLTLGAPAAAGSSTTVLLAAAVTGLSYPNSAAYPVYEKPIDLCWQIEQESVCQATTIDTGAPGGIVAGAAFAPYAHITSPTTATTQTKIGHLHAGTSVAFAASTGATSFASWLAVDSGPGSFSVYNTITDGHLNTGNKFFLGRTVGYDYATGQIRVTANAAAPSAPATVSTTSSSDGLLSAIWADLESVTVTDRLVRVRDSSGAVVQRFNLPGSATSTDISGLDPAQTYTVDIASANKYGISAYRSASPAAARAPRLPDTGFELAPWTILASLLLGAGALTLTANRRTRA
ncbi:hypothetical protein ACFSBZ_10885 [Amnibacterium flavum]|uniref:hypothetical protein n=1 Tax=Amnibacterium flavum TaxID=2173173 RepID=UPI0014041694|nr:hypothetical protein [Amnibacterium flavum]